MFAVPYFVYDIYAMFMCYWYKLQVKGHEEASVVPRHMSSVLTSYLRREFLMVLHHVVMVTVCFPVSVVTHTLFFPSDRALRKMYSAESSTCFINGFLKDGVLKQMMQITVICFTVNIIRELLKHLIILSLIFKICKDLISTNRPYKHVTLLLQWPMINLLFLRYYCDLLMLKVNVERIL